MVSSGLKIISKWVLILIVFGVIIFFLYFHFYPEVVKDFFNKTNINFLDIKTGKPKFKAEFKMPENMRANVEMIYEGITSPDLITDLELNNFEGCQLTIKNKDGNLRMIVDFSGKTEFYDENIKYNPCIVDLGDVTEFTDDYARKKFNEKKSVLQSKPMKLVDKIVFINKNTFKIYDYKRNEDMYNGKIDYRSLEILIRRDNNVCFVGYH